MWNSLPQKIVHATSPASFSAGAQGLVRGATALVHTLRWPTTVTAKPKTSRQNQKPLDKTENLTAKPKTSRQKQNTSRQNQKPHGKTKDLTAKPNTSQQKPNTSR